MPHTVVNEVDLHWSERGTGDVILFLHGFPFDRMQWEPQLAALPSGWRAIAPDLRGFGDSRDAGTSPLTMEQHAADVIALLDQLGIERAVACGLSMGGYIALALAQRAPQRLRALVLCDTKADPDGEAARETRRQTAARARAEGVESVVAGLLPKLLAAHTREAQPEQVARLEAMMLRSSAASLARASLGMAERADARPLLAQLRMPVLVIGGAEDALTPPDTLRALAQGIPGAELELLADAGHVSNLEQPGAFNRALHAFLAGLR